MIPTLAPGPGTPPPPQKKKKKKKWGMFPKAECRQDFNVFLDKIEMIQT